MPVEKQISQNQRRRDKVTDDWNDNPQNSGTDDICRQRPSSRSKGRCMSFEITNFLRQRLISIAVIRFCNNL